MGVPRDWYDDVIFALSKNGKRELELKLLAHCFYYCTASDNRTPVLKFEYYNKKGKYSEFIATRTGYDTLSIVIDNRLKGETTLKKLKEFFNGVSKAYPIP